MLQTFAIFEFEHFQTLLVNQLFGNSARFYGILDGWNDGAQRTRKQQYIHTGLQGFDFAVTYPRVVAAQTVHIHRIGNDDAVEGHLFFQQFGNDGIGECGNRVAGRV